MNKNHRSGNTSSGLAIGMCLGLAIGTAIGAAADNMGLWMPMGLSVGMCLGLVFGGKSEDDENGTDRKEGDEYEEGSDNGKKDRPL